MSAAESSGPPEPRLRIEIAVEGAAGDALERAVADLQSRLDLAMNIEVSRPEIARAPGPDSDSDSESDVGLDSDSDSDLDSNGSCFCDEPEDLDPGTYSANGDTCKKCGLALGAVALGRASAACDDRARLAAEREERECDGYHSGSSAHFTDSESESEPDGPAPPSADDALRALFGPALAGGAGPSAAGGPAEEDLRCDEELSDESEEEDRRCDEEVRAFEDCEHSELTGYGGLRMTVEFRGGEAEAQLFAALAPGQAAPDHDEETPLPVGVAEACGDRASDVLFDWGRAYAAHRAFFAGVFDRQVEEPTVLLPTPVADVLARADRESGEMEQAVERAPYEEFRTTYLAIARELAWTQAAHEAACAGDAELAARGDLDWAHPDGNDDLALSDLHEALSALDDVIFESSWTERRGTRRFPDFAAMRKFAEEELPSGLRAPDALPRAAMRIYRDVVDNFEIRAEQDLFSAEPAADPRAFARLVCEIGQEFKSDLGFSAEAVAALQAAAEEHVAEHFGEFAAHVRSANIARLERARDDGPWLRPHEDVFVLRGGVRRRARSPARSARDAAISIFGRAGAHKRRREHNGKGW